MISFLPSLQTKLVKEQILENDRRVRASARATELGRRGSGAGQQNGPHNLGAHDKRRTLSRTYRSGRVGGIAIGAIAPLRLGRADRSECIKPVDTAGSGKPIRPKHFECEFSIGT